MNSENRGKPVEFPGPLSTEQQLKLARADHDFWVSIAKKMDCRIDLNDVEVAGAIDALKFAAERALSFTPVRPPGPPTKVDAVTLAVEFGVALLAQRQRGQKINEAAAHEALAQMFDIDVSTVAKTTRRFRNFSYELAQLETKKTK